MSTLSTRLAEALEAAQLTAPYKNKAGLAKHCGLSPSSMTDWFSGKTKAINYKHALRAAEYLGVNASWLAEGIGAMRSTSVQVYEDTGEGATLPDPNYIVIPQYHVQASAGPGNENPVFEEVDGKECGFSLINGLLIQSLNPEVPDETISGADMQTFHLIGRVRDRSGGSWL